MDEPAFSLLAMAGIWAIFGGFWYFFLYPFRRRFRQGEIVWYKLRKKWYLAKVTDDKPEFDYVVHVVIIGDNHPTQFDDWDRVAGHSHLRPIRWWQRNKVDPIVAKHFLLNGM